PGPLLHPAIEPVEGLLGDVGARRRVISNDLGATTESVEHRRIGLFADVGYLRAMVGQRDVAAVPDETDDNAGQATVKCSLAERRGGQALDPASEGGVFVTEVLIVREVSRSVPLVDRQDQAGP